MNIESYASISESAKIHGVALIPRISRNENLYTKKELERFNGVTVPLNWEHNGDKLIGEVTFQYDATSETVYYEGQITDPSAALLAKNKLLYTSIEAQPTSVKQVCNGSDDCFRMPFGLIPEALALTETPGIPESSVRVMKESIDKKIAEIKEHDHNEFKKYGASDIIHQTLKLRDGVTINVNTEAQGGETTADNIMQKQVASMEQGLEQQIVYKNEALELFKTLAKDNPEPMLGNQIEMIENDIAVLSGQLISLRKGTEYINVEHSLKHIIDNMKEKYICSCCNEAVDLSGPQSTIIPKKKKKDERVGLSLPSTVKAKKN